MGNDFGKFLCEKRKEAGLTQKDVAEKLFISESAVSKWEKNKSNPDISMVSELSKILNVSEHELITASIDREERQQSSDAKKWKRLSDFWNLFFLISYLIAVVSCFVCNILIDKTLSWFWVVLCSVICAMSFTSLPKYIDRGRLFFSTIIELVSICLLIFVCCIYTDGDWFLLAIIPCVVAFNIIFLPLYIKKYNLPKFFKFNNALISIIIDIVLVLAMLYYIEFKLEENWFMDFALPITLYLSIMPLIFALFSYFKFSKLLKASFINFLFIPFLGGAYFLAKKLILKQFDIAIDELAIPNFSDWQNNTMISSNVLGIVAIVMIFISLLLFILYFVKRSKKRG